MTSPRASIIACAALWLSASSLLPQTPAPNPPQPEGTASSANSDLSVTSTKIATLVENFTTSSMNDFVTSTLQTAAAACPIGQPKLRIEDVPSFGSYDPDTNTLTISSWSLLKPEERSIFQHDGATEADARADFELGVHHWVVVHELGHWWQACRGIKDTGKHYDMESGANRIAAAYWRERDPAVIAHQAAVFDAILSKWPNPVTQGQDVQSYFDANYEKLGPTPAYIWFQASMCRDAFHEKPTPTFSQVLQQTKP